MEIHRTPLELTGIVGIRMVGEIQNNLIQKFKKLFQLEKIIHNGLLSLNR